MAKPVWDQAIDNIKNLEEEIDDLKKEVQAKETRKKDLYDELFFAYAKKEGWQIIRNGFNNSTILSAVFDFDNRIHIHEYIYYYKVQPFLTINIETTVGKIHFYCNSQYEESVNQMIKDLDVNVEERE